MNYDTPRQGNIFKDNGISVIKRIQTFWPPGFSMDSLHQVSMCLKIPRMVLMCGGGGVSESLFLTAAAHILFLVLLMSIPGAIEGSFFPVKLPSPEETLALLEVSMASHYQGMQNRCTNTGVSLGPWQVPHLSLFLPCPPRPGVPGRAQVLQLSTHTAVLPICLRLGKPISSPLGVLVSECLNRNQQSPKLLHF